MSQTLVQTGATSEALDVAAMRRRKPVRDGWQGMSSVIPNRYRMTDPPSADARSVSRIA